MKKFTTSLLILIILMAINACREQQQESIDTKQQEQEKKQEQTSTNQQASSDSIVYDDFYYPDDTNYLAKMLVPGIFHEDEVWEGADRLKWFGLFHKGEKYYLAETDIRTPRVNDVILDDSEDEKTGWSVEVLHPDTAILLVTGLDSLKDKSIEQVSLAKFSLIPGDTLAIHYLGLEYRLYAGGHKRKHSTPDGEWYELWNYRLYLAAKLNGKWVEDLLVAAPNFDDAMIIIQFAGDIDGDKRLDLLIDTSDHYNADCPTLYLSRPAEKGHIIKVVGMHCSVGC